MKLARLLAAFVLVAASIVAMPSFAQGEANCSIFYAGQDEAVGSVCVTIDDDTAYLDYMLEDGWTMTEAHAWIGDVLSNLPQTQSGSPAPELFPFSATGLDNVTEYSVAIPVSDLAVNLDVFCSAEVFVSANGVVHKVVENTDDDSDDNSDHSVKSGKGDHSYKSGKGGYSDKSGKSSYSGKSGKGSYGKKSDKGGYSKKSDKNSYYGKSYSQKSDKYSKSSYGKKSSDKSGKGHSGKSGKGGYSDKSGKGHSGKSGKGGHSEKSSKGDHHDNDDCNGDHNGGGTGTTVRTEQAWAGDIIIGEGSYFSFTNDFCPEEEPETEIVLPEGCFNLFMNGTGQTRFGVVSATPFTPFGILDGATAWVNNSISSVGARGAMQASIGSAGTAQLTPGEGDATLKITLSDADLIVMSANVHYSPSGSFDNILPLYYDYTFEGNGTSSLTATLPLVTTPNADLVVHAIMCVNTGDQ